MKAKVSLTAAYRGGEPFLKMSYEYLPVKGPFPVSIPVAARHQKSMHTYSAEILMKINKLEAAGVLESERALYALSSRARIK
jgi:hypothetical protein